MGLFIIFMAGTILHYYLPVSGAYGVYIEGVLLGVIVALHVNKVINMYHETCRREGE